LTSIHSSHASSYYRDEIYLTKLQQLGMTSVDENKLLAMREYILKLANATSRYFFSSSAPEPKSSKIHSFTSRLNYEPDTGKSLKVSGDVELQKLGVVPQTVFLKSRNSDITAHSSRVLSFRRSTYNSSSSRTPIQSPRLLRGSSVDRNSTGAPFEDLRRRLQTINASSSSLSLANTSREHRISASGRGTSSSSLAALAEPSPIPERPLSPTESVVSTTNSVSLRPTNRLQIGTDGTKAAPAVGSSKTNATGVLEAHSKIRSEGSPERSGRSSPMSMSTTLRAHRPRVPSMLPISTYGMSVSFSPVKAGVNALIVRRPGTRDQQLA